MCVCVCVLRLASCVRFCKEFVCPYASCSDCCIVLCWSWLVVVVVVECCCCIPYQLALMLVLTIAPSVLTFAPCTCGVILLVNQRKYSTYTWWWSLAVTCTGGIFSSAIGVNTPCTGGGVTCCNLGWWSFSFHPLAHILYSNYIYVYIYRTSCRIFLFDATNGRSWRTGAYSLQKASHDIVKT